MYRNLTRRLLWMTARNLICQYSHIGTPTLGRSVKPHDISNLSMISAIQKIQNTEVTIFLTENRKFSVPVLSV